jgi:HlyD family secretion protein
MSSRAVKGGLALGVVLLVLGLAYAYGARFFGNDLPRAVSVTGTIEATQVDVSVKIAGRIVARLVNEGDRVTAGQVLVRLDDSELLADVHRQEAAVRTAEATLRDLLAGARPEEIKEARATAARARAQLDDLLAGSRAQEIEEARATLRGAEATREMKERDLRRIEELTRKELVAQQDLDRAREAYQVAAAQERTARERLGLTIEGPRRQQIEAARADVRATEERLALLLAGPRPDQVEATRGQLAQAQSALGMARSRLREATVISPIDGRVLRKNLEVGETANPGVSILTLMNPREVWVRAYVPEEQVGRVRLGDGARVSVDGYPGRVFSGRVSEIASEAEFTPRNVQTKKERVNLVFRIKVMLDNPEGLLKPGMPADAEIG